MCSLLSKASVQIVASKNRVISATPTNIPPIQSILDMAKGAFANLDKKHRTTFYGCNELEKKTQEHPNFKNFRSKPLIEVQEAISKYFEEERKSILIDISSMERKNDSLIIKYIKRESTYVIDGRKINEIAKLIRYKLKRLPEHTAIKKVLLEEDNFA